MWWFAFLLIFTGAYAADESDVSSLREVTVTHSPYEIRIAYTASYSRSRYSGRRFYLGEPGMLSFSSRVLNEDIRDEELRDSTFKRQLSLLAQAYATYQFLDPQPRLSVSIEDFLDQWVASDAHRVIGLQQRALSQQLDEIKAEDQE